MNNMQIRENPESWVISGDDLIVTQCRIDYSFGLELWKLKEHYLSLRIEGIFRFDSGEKIYNIFVEKDPESVGPVLRIINQEIKSITINKDGDLELVFTNGMNISVSPSPDFEAWTLSGAGGLLFVCSPGGNIVRWKPK